MWDTNRPKNEVILLLGYYVSAKAEKKAKQDIENTYKNYKVDFALGKVVLRRDNKLGLENCVWDLDIIEDTYNKLKAKYEMEIVEEIATKLGLK